MQQLPVETVRDLIYLRSAELISRRTFHVPDLGNVSADEHGYIAQIYSDLKMGRWRWRDALADSSVGAAAPNLCALCGATENLTRTDLVPTTVAVNEQCPQCPTLLAPTNQLRCCPRCLAVKEGAGLYCAFAALYPAQADAYRFIPDPVERAYLRKIYRCHECAGTLTGGDLDGDGRLTVLDIDQVIAASAAHSSA